MEIFGIGPLELVFVLLVVILVLGPKDIQKTGKTIGRGLYMLLSSDTWKTVSQFSREIRYLPNKLMRDARLEENEIMGPSSQVAKNQGNKFRAWTTPSDFSNDFAHRPELPTHVVPRTNEDQLSK